MARAQRAGLGPVNSSEPRHNPSFTYDVEGQSHEVWFLDASTFANQLRALDQEGCAGILISQLGCAGLLDREGTTPPSRLDRSHAIRLPADLELCGLALNSPNAPWRLGRLGKARPQGHHGDANLEVLKIPVFCLVAVALAASGCRDKVASQIQPAADPPTKVSQLVVPSEGAYTGAYIDFGESEDDVTYEQIEAFEKTVGKHQAIVASSSYWGEQTFPTHNLEIIVRHHSIPLVYWSPWDKPYQQDHGPDRFSLDAIVAGKWDAYVDAWARQAKEFGRPLFVAWGWR